MTSDPETDWDRASTMTPQPTSIAPVALRIAAPAISAAILVTILPPRWAAPLAALVVLTEATFGEIYRYCTDVYERTLTHDHPETRAPRPTTKGTNP